jgi:hypothetical protein
LKENICWWFSKLNKAWKNKSVPFKMRDLSIVLEKGNLKDPEGLCSEIFQPVVI